MQWLWDIGNRRLCCKSSRKQQKQTSETFCYKKKTDRITDPTAVGPSGICDGRQRNRQIGEQRKQGSGLRGRREIFIGSEIPFWTQETHCIFMVMHLFYFCLKNWQHVAIKVFLQNTVKMSIVTKRHVIDRVGQKKIPHCQQWEVS